MWKMRMRHNGFYLYVAIIHISKKKYIYIYIHVWQYNKEEEDCQRNKWHAPRDPTSPQTINYAVKVNNRFIWLLLLSFHGRYDDVTRSWVSKIPKKNKVSLRMCKRERYIGGERDGWILFLPLFLYFFFERPANGCLLWPIPRPDWLHLFIYFYFFFYRAIPPFDSPGSPLEVVICHGLSTLVIVLRSKVTKLTLSLRALFF